MFDKTVFGSGGGGQKIAVKSLCQLSCIKTNSYTNSSVVTWTSTSRILQSKACSSNWPMLRVLSLERDGKYISSLKQIKQITRVILLYRLKATQKQGNESKCYCVVYCLMVRCFRTISNMTLEIKDSAYHIAILVQGEWWYFSKY